MQLRKTLTDEWENWSCSCLCSRYEKKNEYIRAGRKETRAPFLIAPSLDQERFSVFLKTLTPLLVHSLAHQRRTVETILCAIPWENTNDAPWHFISLPMRERMRHELASSFAPIWVIIKHPVCLLLSCPRRRLHVNYRNGASLGASRSGGPQNTIIRHFLFTIFTVKASSFWPINSSFKKLLR
jgi:hypothetical protein